MRYLVLFFAAVAITAIALVAVGRSREQLHDGKVPLRSGLFQNCATEIPPQPRGWEIRSHLATNLDGTVGVIVMAECLPKSQVGHNHDLGFSPRCQR